MGEQTAALNWMRRFGLAFSVFPTLFYYLGITGKEILPNGRPFFPPEIEDAVVFPATWSWCVRQGLPRVLSLILWGCSAICLLKATSRSEWPQRRLVFAYIVFTILNQGVFPAGWSDDTKTWHNLFAFCNFVTATALLNILGVSGHWRTAYWSFVSLLLP